MKHCPKCGARMAYVGFGLFACTECYFTTKIVPYTNFGWIDIIPRKKMLKAIAA